MSSSRVRGSDHSGPSRWNAAMSEPPGISLSRPCASTSTAMRAALSRLVGSFLSSSASESFRAATRAQARSVSSARGQEQATRLANLSAATMFLSSSSPGPSRSDSIADHPAAAATAGGPDCRCERSSKAASTSSPPWSSEILFSRVSVRTSTRRPRTRVSVWPPLRYTTGAKRPNALSPTDTRARARHRTT